MTARQNRYSSANSRHADPSDPAVVASARAGYRTNHSSAIRRAPQNRGRISLSRTAPAGTARLACGRLADFGERPAGKVLPPDARRKKAAFRRTVELGTPDRGDSPGHATRREVIRATLLQPAQDTPFQTPPRTSPSR